MSGENLKVQNFGLAPDLRNYYLWEEGPDNFDAQFTGESPEPAYILSLNWSTV